MHCMPQSKGTQNSVVCHDAGSSTSSSRLSVKNSAVGDENYDAMQARNFSYPNPSGSSTPDSTGSISGDSNFTSSCSSSSSRPKRSSMKPSLKSPIGVAVNDDRRLSPPTVRFADVELPKSNTWTGPDNKDRRQSAPLSRVPNPLLRYRHHSASSYSSPVSTFEGNNESTTGASQPIVSIHTQQAQSTLNVKKRIDSGTPVSGIPSKQISKWSHIPVPVHSPPAPPVSGSRVSSYNSTVSTLSVQSAPVSFSTSPKPTTHGTQYNPLQNYVPCCYVNCSTHYSPAHAGPTYYLPSKPYFLSRQRGYCPRHATREWKEANALCKREWEGMRQNAGRKTLGLIAAEFEVFLEQFRNERTFDEAKLVWKQKRRVLGTSSAQPSVKGKEPSNDDWDWRYTPRSCTSSLCRSPTYSPFANHLFLFYTVPRASIFVPLRTLCQPCAKSEVERLENCIAEKWASRCGWDKAEWDEWTSNVIKDREMEKVFWEQAQERVVREKGPVKWIGNLEEQSMPKVERQEGKGGRMSIFKRLFGSMST